MEKEGVVLITESIAGVLIAGILLIFLMAIAFAQEENPGQEMAEKLEKKEKQLQEKEDQLMEVEQQLKQIR